jgi:esterase/lipase superfamily enzyme
MDYDNHKERRSKALIRSLLVLLALININLVFSQNKESIAVSKLKAGDSIYIITNREIDSTCKVLSFNTCVDEDTKITFLKVKLSKTLELESTVLSEALFMEQVCKKSSDWLLFVHGDGKNYKESVQRGFDVQGIYDVNVIVFSWPSEVPDINGLKNFKNSESNVLKSVNHFNQLLTFMSSFKKRTDVNLSMLMHSLGNLYLRDFMELPSDERTHDIIFENIVMNSAAVNRENHQEWVEKLNFQKRIFITNNKYDFSLKGLHLYTSHGNQLGEEFNAPTAINANYVHFTEAVGFRTPTSNTHTYFIGEIPRQSKNIRNFYHDVFHGNQINFSDSSQFVQRKEGLGYDIVF